MEEAYGSDMAFFFVNKIPGITGLKIPTENNNNNNQRSLLITRVFDLLMIYLVQLNGLPYATSLACLKCSVVQVSQ